MVRRKGRKRRGSPPDAIVVSWGEPTTVRRPSGWRGLFKAVLICGASGGLVGGAAGAALATDGYAVPAAMIGGLPMGAIGAIALGWYGRLFGAVNRVRSGAFVGALLGLLGAGTLGLVAGLSAWALPWSLAGAIAGAVLLSSLTSPERRRYGLWPGLVAGTLVGIFVRAVRTGPADVMTAASRGAMIGAILGIVLIPALLSWLMVLPTLFRRRRRR